MSPHAQFMSWAVSNNAEYFLTVANQWIDGSDTCCTNLVENSNYRILISTCKQREVGLDMMVQQQMTEMESTLNMLDTGFATKGHAICFLIHIINYKST